MVGLTLSPEQIQRAPAEVKRWLEQEVAGAFGMLPAWSVVPVEAPPHLVRCSLEEARATLERIQGVLPAVSVFFELGREPAMASIGGVHAIGAAALMRQCRLPTPGQLANCLGAINAALQEVRHEPGATLAALDERGYCLVADASSRTILALWQEITAAHGHAGPDGMSLQAGMPPGQAFSAPLPSRFGH